MFPWTYCIPDSRVVITPLHPPLCWCGHSGSGTRAYRGPRNGVPIIVGDPGMGKYQLHWQGLFAVLAASSGCDGLPSDIIDLEEHIKYVKGFSALWWDGNLDGWP